jgi:hypothetical protein
MTDLFYAGIGSRECPQQLQPLIESYARRLAAFGRTLRSGRARGADSFFEAGAGDQAQLFLATGPDGAHTPAGTRICVPSGAILERCLLLASVAHPNWGACSPYARLLHARNVCQVHGPDLTSTVRFVVAWAPPAGPDDVSGGTGLAWRIAAAAGVDRFNLAVDADALAFATFLNRLERESAPQSESA